MNVLLLGPKRSRMMAVFAAFCDHVIQTEERIDAQSPLLREVEFIVSYGYRHIIKQDVLRLFPAHAINLHISLLPWNRGADPNLWSFLEDTPKGVTIHRIDNGIDTGDILAQREVISTPSDTLKTSYDRLSEAMMALFSQTWGDLRQNRLQGNPQPLGEGSYHRMHDKECFAHLLVQDWETPVANLIGKALKINGEISDD